MTEEDRGDAGRLDGTSRPPKPEVVLDLLRRAEEAEAAVARAREVADRMSNGNHGPCTGTNCAGCTAGKYAMQLRQALDGEQA